MIMKVCKSAKIIFASGTGVLALASVVIAAPAVTTVPMPQVIVSSTSMDDDFSSISDFSSTLTDDDFSSAPEVTQIAPGVQVFTPRNVTLHPDVSMRPMGIGWLDWSRWWQWIGNWKAMAEDLISQVPSHWKQWVLRNGLRGAAAGWTADAITSYYKSQGLYCPPAPWWLPGLAKLAWSILTPAEYAR